MQKLVVFQKHGVETGHCPKCNRDLKSTEFYGYQNSKQKITLCKKCLTLQVDNFDPSTYLWILKQLDFPYIESEWNVLRDKAYAKDPLKMNGTTVLGKYLSKMRLSQFKGKGWDSSQNFANEQLARAQKLSEQQQAANEQLKTRFESGEISEAQYRTLATTEYQHATDNLADMVVDPTTGLSYRAEARPVAQNVNGRVQINVVGPAGAATMPSVVSTAYVGQAVVPDLGQELTEDDVKYLAMKWGSLYQPTEWIALEKKYQQMMNSFDIQDSDTMSSLIFIAKLDLKMNQCLDQGDIEGFQKLARAHESLRKTAKFTAAQNKEQKNDYVDCVGEIVEICEKQGFIPRFATEIPQDKVDETLKDLQRYTHKLVTEDLGLGQQIENAIKKIELQRQQEQLDQADEEIEDEDIIQYNDFIQADKAEDDQRVGE